MDHEYAVEDSYAYAPEYGAPDDEAAAAEYRVAPRHRAEPDDWADPHDEAPRRAPTARPAPTRNRPATRVRHGLRRVRLSDSPSGGRIRLGVPYQSAWLSYVIALMLFLLLTSGDLVRTVRAMDIGPVRTVTLPMANGVDRVSNLLSLNRPADAIGAALGREVHDPVDQQVDFNLPATPPEDLTPPLREVTADVPLEVHVAGDSMGQPLGQLLEAAAVDDPTLDVTYEYKISSGLSRPDYYNWPARFAEIAQNVKPEALVMMIGGNDGQELTDPAGNVVARPGTDEWRTEYRRRIDELFDGLRADNRRLFWVLQPKVASSKLQGSLTTMNEEVTASAAKRPWVTLIDGPELTSGPDGGYADYLTLEDGSQIDCRQGDGVHLTIDCSRLVTDAAVDDIVETWAIGEAAAPAGTPLDPTNGRDASGPAVEAPVNSPAAEAPAATADSGDAAED
ncbi:MAG: DUF459 domain-containing protein [Microthrixaceae bacterium]|nr:DUF459 domain-containing protein [Microthrixaceae bacterium]